MPQGEMVFAWEVYTIPASCHLEATTTTSSIEFMSYDCFSNRSEKCSFGPLHLSVPNAAIPLTKFHFDLSPHSHTAPHHAMPHTMDKTPHHTTPHHTMPHHTTPHHTTAHHTAHNTASGLGKCLALSFWSSAIGDVSSHCS